jgi:hypothetical protein
MGNSLSDSVDLLIPFLGKFGSGKVEVAESPFFVHVLGQNKAFPTASIIQIAYSMRLIAPNSCAQDVSKFELCT